MGSCQAMKKKSPQHSKSQLEIQIPSKKTDEQGRKSVFSQVKSAGIEKKQSSSQRQSVFVSQVQGINNSMGSPQIKTKARMSTPIVDVVKIEQDSARTQKHKATFKMNATVKKSAFCKFYSVQQSEKGSQPRGGNGNILVSHNVTGKLRYADYLDNSSESTKYVQELIKHQFSHPNIANVVEILEDKSQYVVIKECIQGQPLSYQEPPEKQILIIQQIIEAVSYLHSLKLTHGALCLSAFERNDDLVQLIDLKSIFIRHDPNHHDIEYLAPESTNDSYVYTRERDIWAVGMMIHNIIHGKYFQVSGLQDIMKEVVSLRIKKHIHIEGENKEFLENFLHITIQKRTPLIQVLEDPFFQGKNKQQLKLDPIIKRNKHLKEITIIQQCLLLLFINQFEDEKFKYQQLFKNIDQDHDGKISKKDCLTLFPDLEDDIYFIFNLLQVKDKMNFQEFLILAVDRQVILTESNMDTIFNLYSTMKKCIHSNTLINIYQSREFELKEAFDLEDHPYLNYENFQSTLRKLL